MVRIPQPAPTSSCCCGCSLRSSVFIFAVLDCISGTLGFVGSIITLISKASVSFTTVRTNVPVQHILELFLFTLIIASGAVGIQAFNTLHVPTARLLFLLKLITFIFVTLVLFVNIMSAAFRGEKVSTYVVFVILWNVAIPGYIVYIIWSFYKHLEENNLEGPLPLTTRVLDPYRNADRGIHNQPLPGLVVQTQGHCNECFLVPGSNSATCSTCALYNSAESVLARQSARVAPSQQIVTGHPVAQQGRLSEETRMQPLGSVGALGEPVAGRIVAGSPVFFTVQFSGDVLRVVDAATPSDSQSRSESQSSSDLNA